MTPRMKDFLDRAAKVEEGKGMLIEHYDKRIASRAVGQGYGWMITAPLPIFIIEPRWRAALVETAKPTSEGERDVL